jgi:hypothetical protein
LGKGFKGTCYTCGLEGHSADRCQKGKGKGGIREVGGVEDHNHGGEGGSCNHGPKEEGEEGVEGDGWNIGSLRFGGGGLGRLRKIEIGNRFSALEEERNEVKDEIHLGNILGIEDETQGEGWWTRKGKKIIRLGSGNAGNASSKKHQGEGSIDKISATRVIYTEWEEINITVDSGAVDHVAGKDVGSQFQMKDTEMSKKGGYYMAANDTRIYNEGERRVTGYTKEGKKAGMVFQVCNVNGPLGSVRRICQEGSRVVFDEEGSYIEDKATKERTRIEDVGSSYVLKGT